MTRKPVFMQVATGVQLDPEVVERFIREDEEKKRNGGSWSDAY